MDVVKGAHQPAWRQRLLVALPATAVIIGLLAVLAYGLLSPRNATGQARLDPKPAPDFTLPLFTGGEVRLSELRGQVVVLNYWASWCPPCRDESPLLEQTWNAYRDRGVVFLGIDVQDNDQDARDFIQQFGLTYPNGPDRSGAISIDYGLSGVPETFFINRAGTIVRKYNGPLNAQQLETFLAEAMR